MRRRQKNMRGMFMAATSSPSTIESKTEPPAEVLQHHLFRPFHYLAIQHGHKARLDWIWPGALTVITITVFCLLPVQPPLLGEHGIMTTLLGLIVLFSAFSVVALVAVASLARGSHDEYMHEDLTRRQFALHLFGYLAVLSFLLFLAIVGAQVVVPSLHVLLSRTLFSGVKLGTGTMFALAFWNMVVETMLGIYFLIERVKF